MESGIFLINTSFALFYQNISSLLFVPSILVRNFQNTYIGMNYVSEEIEEIMAKTGQELIKVAIVDDNKSTVSSLKEFLLYSSKIIIVFVARSGDEFLETMKALAPEEIPDVVIMDVNMPGMSGIEAVRYGKALYPPVKFLMLTVFDDDETLFEAISAGASGYLMKDERASVILSHIESLMTEGSAPMSPRIARKTLDLLAASSKPVPGTQVVDLLDLSSREKDVLYLLVDGLEYRDIADKLNISPHTVRKHISNIYEKLHISSKAQAIRLMQGSSNATAAISRYHKILLVDDHQIILDSLSMMIGTIPEMEVIGKINDPREVGPFLLSNPVDIIITDINMPYIDGLALAAYVRDHHPGIKILILTVSESADQVHQARSLGVEGYILKKANKEELTNAIRNILRGEKYYSQSLSLHHT
jgi:DNA-binding NarL/FixJ family response regulator